MISTCNLRPSKIPKVTRCLSNVGFSLVSAQIPKTHHGSGVGPDVPFIYFSIYSVLPVLPLVAKAGGLSQSLPNLGLVSLVY